MKSWAIFFLVGLVGGTQAQALDRTAGLNEPGLLGRWEAQGSSDVGMSVQVPCKAMKLFSDPQDGYGHPTKYYELRCSKELGGRQRALFRVSRTTYPSDPNLARQDFQRYVDYVRAGPKEGPTVRLAGQLGEVHIDYALKQRQLRGDLGFTELQDSCSWNFMGLDGGSKVQVLIILPLGMCPSDGQPLPTGAASKFFDSIFYDDWGDRS